ncbi:P-loop containing nucleoside triphosphate hydrolase protein [Truncatella angustata]|uniref:P-loop containing nucleoside triphosphate hydrolase protein n=1 Tax=Truncatella angustata TaxID=152316 RepID=A0A9P8UER2_9PEZI|nr:P-loop containing nucleoside triphosphate hydrolase protein [Truncatella angustata]KAH6648581.1 P-loop containing nucleoside triphosphate hydrolase protein [Truncatella angustata]
MTTSEMNSLQSKDHKVLMDTIDKLRSKGISRYVDLPQIVVCGDQSSGKSSVLQAISGMSFPIKDNLCTRFATELILRHVPDAPEKCKVSIQPGNDRSAEERIKLEQFNYSAAPKEIDISALVEKAKMHMSLGEESKTFSSDILRIEVIGPAQPNLTIVDLPGLFRAGNKEQSAEDADTVRELVRTYMSKSLSIILAVVSAKSDFALQEVTQLARKIDRHGHRTIGLITKPDTLDAGSDSERAYLELAQNHDVHFRLGWHILRNRDYTSRDATNDERDRQEEAFLAQGAWAALPQKQKGVAALRSRLSGVLTNQILEQLPELISKVDHGLQECSHALEKLGISRATMEKQRSYLLQASYRFATLMREAISGLYSDVFFGNIRDYGANRKRLRAVIQNILTDFAEHMRQNGQSRRIVEQYDEGDQNGSVQVLRSEYLQEVKKLMRDSRGCELPGTFNPLIITELFRDQCVPWKSLITNCSNHVLAAVNHTVDLVLSYVVDENTRSELWKELIIPELELLNRSLLAKTDEILASHTSRHPITYNHYLTENVQKAQKQRSRKALMKRLQENGKRGGVTPLDMTMSEILDFFETQTEADMELFASSTATDVMEAYYKVALKRVVDDFSDLAIEACLISKLPSMFSPDRVDSLSQDNIRRIASENEETTQERISLVEKQKVLSEGLTELKRLIRNHQLVPFNEPSEKRSISDIESPTASISSREPSPDCDQLSLYSPPRSEAMAPARTTFVFAEEAVETEDDRIVRVFANYS